MNWRVVSVDWQERLTGLIDRERSSPAEPVVRQETDVGSAHVRVRPARAATDVCEGRACPKRTTATRQLTRSICGVVNSDSGPDFDTCSGSPTPGLPPACSSARTLRPYSRDNAWSSSPTFGL